MDATGSPDGPGRPGLADVVLRGVLVVALVAGAGLTLQARQGLDWDALADPLQVRWARVLAGTVVLLLLASMGRHLLHRLRRAKRPRVTDGGRAEPEGEPFPFLLRVLAVVLVLATLTLAWYLIDAVSGQVPDPRFAPPATGPAGQDVVPPQPQPDWPTLLVVGALLVAVALAARIHAVRRGRPGDPVGSDAEVEPDVEELASAVAAAETHLAGPGDARSAIVAAYTAMVARIGSGLSGRGGAASAADTPTELLQRAAAAGLVDGAAAGTLTGLFREARFSRHPMGEPHRRRAEQALAQVRDELAARHA